MDIDKIAFKLTEHIQELEKAHAKCIKGILKVDDAEKLIQRIRKSLGELLPENSDTYELYNRFKLENALLWDVTSGHGYAEKSGCNNIEKELKILGELFDELNTGNLPSSLHQNKQFHIKKGESAKALTIIHKIMGKSKTSLVIVDSYLDQSIYDHITSLDKSITFQILTKEKNLKPIFLRTATKLQDEDWNIIIKSSTIFHDRYIILDDEEIWHIGASIKDAGKKDFTITKINEIEQKEKIRESYNNAWQDSITLCSGRKINVTKYRVDLQFPVYIQNEDEGEAKLEAKKLGEQWISKVEKELSVNFQRTSEDSDFIKGSFSSIEDLNLELRWNYRGYDGTKYYMASTINITTSNKTTLNRIIRAGKHPYWAIYYSLDSWLDLDAIQDEMQRRTGDSGWVGGYVHDKDGNKIPMTLEYRNIGLLIQLHAGNSEQGQITLSFLRGGLSGGFMKAHEIFTPSRILSVLYGEFSPMAFKKLVDEAS